MPKLLKIKHSPDQAFLNIHYIITKEENRKLLCFTHSKLLQSHTRRSELSQEVFRLQSTLASPFRGSLPPLNNLLRATISLPPFISFLRFPLSSLNFFRQPSLLGSLPLSTTIFGNGLTIRSMKDEDEYGDAASAIAKGSEREGSKPRSRIR